MAADAAVKATLRYVGSAGYHGVTGLRISPAEHESHTASLTTSIAKYAMLLLKR
jgi:hypothetical protein